MARPGRPKRTAKELEAAVRGGENLIPEHVARITGVSRASVQRWLDNGQTSDEKPWRHVKRGRTRYVLAEDVVAFLDESREVRTGKPEVEGTGEG